MSHDNSSLKGKWRVIGPRFKHIPIHVALLHTGKVLAFGGSGNDEHKLKSWDPPELYEPDYTDKTDGKIHEISDKGIVGDLFCVGHAFLPDGRLFVAGGTYKYDGLAGLLPPFSGLEHTYIFDPKDLSWTRIQNMNHGRWYPTCVMLADGKIATFAGLTKHFPWLILRHHEIFSEEKGWEKLEGADKWFPLYPRIHLLPSGELFYAGSYNTHLTFPFSLRSFKIARFNFDEKKWKDMAHPEDLDRQEGSTVLLPLNPKDNYTAKILLIGGGDALGNHPINKVELIDFSNNEPAYKQVEPMTNQRYYVYPVILPDQNILVVGGKKGHKGHHPHFDGCMDDTTGDIKHDPNAIMEAELYHPKDNKWESLASMSVDRLYHANALLLPDGRVMTVGSNPKRRCNELRIEMFYPPYLFKGERPIVSKSPDELNYGQTFEIQIQNNSNISSILLIRPTNTTHCLNPEQRCILLEFDQKTPNCISAVIPTNRNILPPGYYMLFVVDEQGVPCVAPFVKILL